MRVAAALLVLDALELVGGRLFRAVLQLVVQRVEENLDECVRVIAVQLVLARLPAPVFTDVRATLRVIEEEIGRSSKVLLSMRVVTFRPVVNR